MAETSLGRVKTTNFDNNPTDETPVVNPYKPVALNELNASTPSVSTSSESIDGKISPEQAEALKNDKAYQAKLASEGVTLGQKASQLENELPTGTTLKDAESKGLTVKDLDRDLLRIKDKSKKENKSFDSSFALSALGFMQKAGKLVDPEAYKGLLDSSKKYGMDFTDEITESSFTLGIMDGILGAASKSDIWQYIEGTALGDMFTNFVVEEGLELAAKAGSYTSVKSIIQNHSVSNELRKKSIKWLFGGFRLGDEDLSSGYRQVAKTVVSHFDYIYPNWETILVNSNYRNDHEPITKGNDGILTLLSYHANSATAVDPMNDGIDSRNINKATSIQLTRRYTVEDFNEAIKTAQPDIV